LNLSFYILTFPIFTRSTYLTIRSAIPDSIVRYAGIFQDANQRHGPVLEGMNEILYTSVHSKSPIMNTQPRKVRNCQIP
jgi:hypothetical protein